MPDFPAGPLRVSHLAAHLDLPFSGEDRTIWGIAPLGEADGRHLAFVDVGEGAPRGRPGCLLASAARANDDPTIISEKPRESFYRLIAFLFPEPPPLGIHPDTTIHPSANLGQHISIHAGCRIGAGVKIGDRTILYSNVVVYPGVQIGADCRIHAGVVLGADGFGYRAGDKAPLKIPQIGSLIIGDRVEVGANTTIDRGAIGDTRIGDDTKIDNLVQLAHNVQVGPGVLLAAQVGIAGSATIGAGARLGGQVGVSDHVQIGARAEVGAQAGVTARVAPGERVWGTPAVSLALARRIAASLRRLPDLIRRMPD